MFKDNNTLSESKTNEEFLDVEEQNAPDLILNENPVL